MADQPNQPKPNDPAGATPADPNKPKADAAKPDSAKPDSAKPDAKDTQAVLVDAVRDIQNRIRPSGHAAATPGLDETTPGGKFRVRGKLVNAHNREINDDGTLVHPEDVQTDPFGRRV